MASQAIQGTSTFLKIQSGKVEELSDKDNLRPFLPYVVNILSRSTRKDQLLHGIPEANSVREYINAFSEIDLLSVVKSVLNQDSIDQKSTERFENGSPIDRVQVTIMELLYLVESIKNGESPRKVQLFTDNIYLADITTIISLLVSYDSKVFPLYQIINALLYVPFGCQLLCGIVLNNPHLYHAVLQGIIYGTTVNSQSSPVLSRAKNCVLSLCEISLQYAIIARNELIKKELFPGIVLQVTMDFIKDELVFLSSMIGDICVRGNQPSNPGVNPKNHWFWSYLVSSMREDSQNEASDVVNMLRLVLLKRVEVLSTEISARRYQRVGKLTIVLRCVCAMIGLSGMKLKNTEIERILATITSAATDGKANTNEKFVKVALCMTLMICAIRSEQMKARDPLLVAVDGAIRSLYSTGRSCYTFLLVSLLLHTSQTTKLNCFIQNILDFPVTLSSEGLILFGEVLFKPIFNEAVLTREIISQKVVENLRCTKLAATMSCPMTPDDEIPLRCAYILLCEKSFLRYRIDPSDWIKNQISCSTLPIHPLICGVILEYVECLSTGSTNTNTESVLRPIPLRSIQEAMKEIRIIVSEYPYSNITGYINEELRRDLYSSVMQDSNSQKIWAKAALYTLYVLYCNKRVHAATNETGMGELSVYNTLNFPIRFICAVVSALGCNEDHPFGYILPLLQKHCSSECGLLGLYPIKEAVSIEEKFTAFFVPSSDEFLRLLSSMHDDSDKTFVTVFHIIRSLEELPASGLLPYAEAILRCISIFLFEKSGKDKKDSVSIRTSPKSMEIGNHIENLWLKIRNIHPTPLSLDLRFINTIFSPLNPDSTSITSNQLIEDPYVIFHYNESVFRHLNLTRILLTVCADFMETSKINLNQFIRYENSRIQRNKNGNSDSSLNCEEINVVQSLQNQDCVMIHCLIEKLNDLHSFDDLPDDVLNHHLDMEVVNDVTRITQSQHAIIQFIQRLFEQDLGLMKAIHVQGYSKNMINVLVKFAPVMQRCYKFLEEEFETTDADLFCFLACVACSIFRYYPKSKFIKPSDRTMLISKIISKCYPSKDDIDTRKVNNASSSPESQGSFIHADKLLISLLPSLMSTCLEFPEHTKLLMDLLQARLCSRKEQGEMDKSPEQEKIIPVVQCAFNYLTTHIPC